MLTLTEIAIPQRQRGDMLIESMIGMLLMSMMGLAMSMAVGKTSIAQKDMAVRNLAVTQMRDLLQRNGMGTLDLCSQANTIILPNGLTLPVSVSGCSPISITVGDIALTGVQAPLKLTVSDAVLGGQISVGGGA
jgi:Tfp pilus assembly protein PilV